jgi:hypothetical protein
MTPVSHLRHSFHHPVSDRQNCDSARNMGFRHHSPEFSSGAMRNMCDSVTGNRDNHERFGCEPKRNEGNRLDQAQGLMKKLLDLLKSLLKNTENCETKKHCEQPEPKPVCEPINSVMPDDLNAGGAGGGSNGCGPGDGSCGASSSSGDGSCGASSE